MTIMTFGPIQCCLDCDTQWIGSERRQWDSFTDTPPPTSKLDACWSCVSTDGVVHMSWTASLNAPA